ncbi:MAG TPA: hypothetical protein VJ806_06640 [Luteimonas sp.]|nr:hypothetical protein [Luteimonas sp.]
MLAALLWLATSTAFAQSYRVDDSASQVLGSTLRLKPAATPARGTPVYQVSGEIEVLVRLDVAPWLGRRGRIYMRLPERSGRSVIASWTTRGRLLPGTVRSGERALVYNGPISVRTIEDTQRLRIEADGRYLRPSEQLEFTFEIDLDPS